MWHNSAEYLHHLIEAKKIAYADLARHVADPAYMRVAREQLITEGYIAKRRALLDPIDALDPVHPGAAFTDGETIYLAAADGEGNMVSFIHSVAEHCGSGVAV